MNPSFKEVLSKKRSGLEHGSDELRWFIGEYVRGNIKDSQMAAWLMAVYFQGLSVREMRDLTRIMWKSGHTLPRDSKDDYWIDKHSTGGVGDKTSFILVPLVSSVCERLWGAGEVKIPMISGRTLGHTGGTLDKLEAVAGFSAALSMSDALTLLCENGFFMMGQTDELAPADKLLYGLRDATQTVDSVPLMVSSILSKKLCENLDGIVFDVKFGEGTHLQQEGKSHELAALLLGVAKSHNLHAVVVKTRMDEPLGWAAGNGLEVEECLEFLQGTRREKGLYEVVVALASWMIKLAGRGRLSLEECRSECEKELAGRAGGTSALEKFKRMFEAQGGDMKAFGKLQLQIRRLPRVDFAAERAGFVARIGAKSIGELICRLGGGRDSMENSVDHCVGIEFTKKVGDKVEKGETIATAFYRASSHKNMIEETLKTAVEITEQVAEMKSWVLGVLK